MNITSFQKNKTINHEYQCGLELILIFFITDLRLY